MPRYTGWRRLSGDGAARPDLLDLGKRLLGYLAEQRRLSGVKTLSIRRQAPDGSTVIARFIGDLPDIQIIAAPAVVGGRKVIALRMMTYLFSPTPNRQYIRALVDLDYFDPETFDLVASPRKVLAWANNGSGVPRTNFCFTAPSGQPYRVDGQTMPQYVGIVLSNSFGLYDTKLKSIGSITNGLWTSIYGVSITTGSETYEATAALPEGTLVSLGAARDATPSQNILETLIFTIDVETRQAVAGQKLADVLGATPSSIYDFQASPSSNNVFLLHPVAGPGVRLVKLSSTLSNVGALDFAAYSGPAIAFAHDGRLFAYAKVNGQPRFTVFQINPDTLTIVQQRDIPTPSQAWLSLPPRMFLGEKVVYCVTEDAQGPCLEVRNLLDLELVRRVPLDALESALTGVAIAPAWVVGPGEKRIYVSGVSGRIVVFDGKTGELLENFDASTLDQATGFPVQSFSQDEAFYTGSNVSVSRNFFLAL